MSTEQAIKARRDALKLSMRAAAQAADISATAWSDLEAGKHPPTVQTQRKVAHALDWPLDWLEVVQRGEQPVALTQPDGGAVAALERRLSALEAEVRVLGLKLLRQAHDGEAAEVGGGAVPRPTHRTGRA